MIKNIIIGVLAVVSVFFVLFANIKAKEAEKQAIQAQLNLELAKSNEQKAQMEMEKATKAAAIVHIERRKAEELQQQLDDCK